MGAKERKLITEYHLCYIPRGDCVRFGQWFLGLYVHKKMILFRLMGITFMRERHLEIFPEDYIKLLPWLFSDEEK